MYATVIYAKSWLPFSAKISLNENLFLVYFVKYQIKLDDNK